jgi:hypothetical protein
MTKRSSYSQRKVVDMDSVLSKIPSFADYFENFSQIASTKYKHFQNWPIKHFLPLLIKTAMLCWKRCFAYKEWEWSTIHTVYIYIGTKNHFSGFAGWIGAFSSISSTGNSVRYSTYTGTVPKSSFVQIYKHNGSQILSGSLTMCPPTNWPCDISAHTIRPYNEPYAVRIRPCDILSPIYICVVFSSSFFSVFYFTYLFRHLIIPTKDGPFASITWFYV